MACPGNAAKNSLASFAIIATSGNDAGDDKFSYEGVSEAVAASDACATARSLVLVVLIDIHVLQHAEPILGQHRNGAIQ
jgi:hypothetical protein